MTASLKKTDLLLCVLTLLIVIGGVLFWASDLASDPPMYYSGLGQSLATDPAQYVHHARNSILFDNWDPFDYPRWTVYQHSLTSLVGWSLFSLSGVSTTSAGAVGLVLSLGGLLFFLLGLFRHCRTWVLPVVALCYVINVTLLTYGRLSYLENGLVFIASLFFFVYCWFGDRVWGILLSAVLVALATFIGKLFGALLLPTLLVAVFFAGRQNRWRLMAMAVGTYAAFSAVLIIALYGADFSAAFRYVGEQSYGLRGFPAGLSSPWGFFEHLVGYGFKNRMYYLDPDLFMFLLVAGSSLVLFIRGSGGQQKLSPVIVLSASWVGVVVLGLMPLNYSPLRYTLFLIPAVIVLPFVLMDKLLLKKKIAAAIPDWWALAFLGLLFWFALYHLVGNVFYFNNAPYRALTWGCLPGAAVLALVVRYALGRFRLRLGRSTVVLGVLVMIGLSLLANGFRVRRYHYLEHNFNLKEANEDIREILGPDAVVSGPYGPALTIDTDLKAFIHLFGVANIDSTLFDRHPITHIAVDASNLSEAVKGYPQLDGLSPVTSWWIRDTEVKLYRISELFENPQAARYQLSPYEKAVAYLNESQLDSAQIEIDFYLTEHRLTKSCGRLMTDISLRTGQYDNALRMVTTMAEKYPTDFSVQMMCGKVYLLLASKSENQALMPQAYKYIDRGVRVNRFKAGYATQLVQETMRRMQQQQPAPGQTP